MQLSKDARYTYADYVTWDDGKRYELMDGVAYMLAAPSVDHQRISRELSRQLANYLVGKKCEMFPAPFDVRLNPNAADDTVVQPDITVVCDPAKIANGKSCIGAPDMVVEILSPATMGYDQVVKFNHYRKAGIQEYWMVYPQAQTVQVFLLKDGEYIGKTYAATATIPITILQGCTIDLTQVFPATPPP